MRPGMAAEALGFEWLEERAVDDFVFMCMLVGNDFIPGLPHLSVEDGALNKMLRTYTDMLPTHTRHVEGVVPRPPSRWRHCPTALL